MNQANEWVDRLNACPWNEIHFEWHEQLESTQDRAQELLDSTIQRGAVVVANAQSKGRGRSGREWISKENSGLFMSLTWRMNGLTQWLPVLPLIVASACVEAMRAIPGVSIPAHVKWPNDLYVQQRKIGGILIDSRTNAAEHRTDLVIGLGITLHAGADSFPREWRDRATAWSIEQAHVPSAARLGSACYTAIRMALERFEQLATGLAEPYGLNNNQKVDAWKTAIKEWIETYMIWNEIELPYRIGEQLIQGKALKLNEHYHLQILTEDQQMIWLRN